MTRIEYAGSSYVICAHHGLSFSFYGPFSSWSEANRMIPKIVECIRSDDMSYSNPSFSITTIAMPIEIEELIDDS